MDSERGRAAAVLARFNRRVGNPVQRQWAWLLPPYAVVCHTGRHSGKLYRTPVSAWGEGALLVIPLLYGQGSDWVRNVLAGGGHILRAGRRYPIVSARVCDVDMIAARLHLAGRFAARRAGKVLTCEVSGPHRSSRSSFCSALYS